jgi:pimeloyl-ACP methyl ester carboxylesterase
MADTINYAFLHGGGQGGWVWAETMAALEQQAGGAARAVAFDLPGCGAKRDQDTSQLTVRAVAEAFVADLADSGMTDIVLVGHSNAGTLLPLVAELRPDLVRRYIYLACIVPPPGESIRSMITKRRADAAKTDIPSGGRLRDMFCNDMPEDYATAFMAKLGFDNWPTLEALNEADWRYDHLADKRATYVICLQDQAEVPEWQEVYATRLHVQRRVRLDAGHQAMNTRPHGLAEILRVEALQP